jgi:hypothetical protein
MGELALVRAHLLRCAGGSYNLIRHLDLPDSIFALGPVMV